ncbi:dipeptidase PepV [Clostridium grantii]|uniref:Succinyl-diaminopimelate desuccinylase n=1 Tax=Clostridium grantii DSM 8605 TaxID=1121316 RepID=A0A1M5WK10_9CLOT|nr:dipeptidase PepV [Clostridium grantii]SHH87886.1 succinyl-diaminopimelate desuccinylase [Clostridium grantii DSM 8605]
MQFNEYIDDYKEDLIESTKGLVRIKSIEEEEKDGMPFGEGPALALQYALNTADSMGFKTVNMDNYVGFVEYGQGEEYIAVLGHVDVVPEGSGWKYNPYGAEIHDDKIYGRGTIDDKGPIMAALYGLKAIKDSGIKISKKIRIIFGTNEESGCGEIQYYLDKEKAPVAAFTPDADYPVINGEKGITFFQLHKDFEVKSNKEKIIYIKGGSKANMVPDYCEMAIKTDREDIIVEYANTFKEMIGFDIEAEIKGDLVIVVSKGKSAHGSTPEVGVNAIMQLLAFAGELELDKCDATRFIEFMNIHIGLETDGESFGVYMKDEVSGELSFNVGLIDMNEETVKLELNLRYPVTHTFEEMMEGIDKTLDGTGMRIQNMIHQEPLYFPEDHPLVETLSKIYSEATGVEAKPFSIGGGTYAKEMPNTVAFGPLFPGREELAHQVDEYIFIDDLVLNAKIYAEAIYRLAK